MPETEVGDPQIKQREFDRLSAPMELDLVAFFTLMEDDVSILLRKAKREGWDENQFINEVINLVGGE